MPPKKAAASSGNNAKQKVSLALEAHSDLDLKKFLENYPKNAARFQQEVHFGIISRFKSEYQAIRDMVQMDVPKFPISIHEPLCFEALTSLLLTLESYPWLRHICFWKCQLEDDGAMLIADFIRHQFQIIYDKNPWGVETVELPQNKIGPRGVNFIGRMLTTNETIKVLVLDFNPIESEGAILLSDGLKWNSTLERLSLHYCSIGPDGGEAIGHHIVRSSGIKSLELRGNPIGPRGVISIGHALAKNAHLVKLDLANTAFGLDLEAVEVLRDGIESNETLEWVDLNLNSIIPTGAPLLVEMLAKKSKITRFELYERVAHGLFNETMIALSNNVKAGKKKGKGKKRGNSAKGKKSKGPPAPST